MKKMQRNLKLDRRTLMQNEVPVKKTILERLVATEKAFDEKKVLLFEVKISTLPVGSNERKYYAVDPENLIVQQKAQLLKQDGLMRDMRTEFNTKRTTLEKQIKIARDQADVSIAGLMRRWKIEKRYYLASIAVACLTIILMIFI